jgi:hypothetical protein
LLRHPGRAACPIERACEIFQHAAELAHGAGHRGQAPFALADRSRWGGLHETRFAEPDRVRVKISLLWVYTARHQYKIYCVIYFIFKLTSFNQNILADKGQRRSFVLTDAHSAPVA